MQEPVEVDVVSLDPAVPRPSFEDFYVDRFLPMVRMATLLCGRAEVARDIVQDAFVKLHMKWASVEYPKAYLRRSVVNGCRSQARWERLRRGRSSEQEASIEQAPDELFDVLASLPHRQRAAIVLKYYEQRTEAEIAGILGCRPGTVGSLVSRGLTGLRAALTLEGGGS